MDSRNQYPEYPFMRNVCTLLSDFLCLVDNTVSLGEYPIILPEPFDIRLLSDLLRIKYVPPTAAVPYEYGKFLFTVRKKDSRHVLSYYNKDVYYPTYRRSSPYTYKYSYIALLLGYAATSRGIDLDSFDYHAEFNRFSDVLSSQSERYDTLRKEERARQEQLIPTLVQVIRRLNEETQSLAIMTTLAAIGYNGLVREAKAGMEVLNFHGKNLVECNTLSAALREASECIDKHIDMTCLYLKSVGVKDALLFRRLGSMVLQLDMRILSSYLYPVYTGKEKRCTPMRIPALGDLSVCLPKKSVGFVWRPGGVKRPIHLLEP